jgi:hypothetical protein
MDRALRPPPAPAMIALALAACSASEAPPARTAQPAPVARVDDRAWVRAWCADVPADREHWLSPTRGAQGDLLALDADGYRAIASMGDGFGGDTFSLRVMGAGGELASASLFSDLHRRAWTEDVVPEELDLDVMLAPDRRIGCLLLVFAPGTPADRMIGPAAAH